MDGSYDKVTRNAGLGVAVIDGGIGDENDSQAKLIHRIWGPSLACNEEGEQSNNTAELEATLKAIEWVTNNNPKPWGNTIFWRPDSLYTQNIILGKYMPKDNKYLAIKTRKA